jgi:hypothetical protein
MNKQLMIGILLFASGVYLIVFSIIDISVFRLFLHGTITLCIGLLNGAVGLVIIDEYIRKV